MLSNKGIIAEIIGEEKIYFIAFLAVCVLHPVVQENFCTHGMHALKPGTQDCFEDHKIGVIGSMGINLDPKTFNSNYEKVSCKIEAPCNNTKKFVRNFVNISASILYIFAAGDFSELNIPSVNNFFNADANLVLNRIFQEDKFADMLAYDILFILNSYSNLAFKVKPDAKALFDLWNAKYRTYSEYIFSNNVIYKEIVFNLIKRCFMQDDKLEQDNKWRDDLGVEIIALFIINSLTSNPSSIDKKFVDLIIWCVENT